jgi:hypothetical protein
MAPTPTPVAPVLVSRKMGVGGSTYVVVGFVAALPLLAGISGLAGNEKVLGALGVVSAPLIFAYFCLQRIEMDDGFMIYRRPFFPARRVVLSSVTQVRTKWDNSGKPYRHLLFIGGGETLCAINPKLFVIEDLRFIMSEVSVRAPAASIDEDSRAFLPHRGG